MYNLEDDVIVKILLNELCLTLSQRPTRARDWASRPHRSICRRNKNLPRLRLHRDHCWRFPGVERAGTQCSKTTQKATTSTSLSRSRCNHVGLWILQLLPSDGTSRWWTPSNSRNSWKKEPIRSNAMSATEEIRPNRLRLRRWPRFREYVRASSQVVDLVTEGSLCTDGLKRSLGCLE